MVWEYLFDWWPCCRRCLTWWLGVVGRDLYDVDTAAPAPCRGVCVGIAALPRHCRNNLNTAEPANGGMNCVLTLEVTQTSKHAIVMVN